MNNDEGEEKKDPRPHPEKPESPHQGRSRASTRSPRRTQTDLDATMARTHAAFGEVIPAEKAKALDLIPALVNAGFEVLNQFSDSHVLVGPPYFGGVIGILDENGDRLMLRFVQGASPKATAEQRQRFIATANNRLWGKYHFDHDGDLIIEHAICCEGGMFLPNIIRTLLGFASLCRFTVKECDPDGIFREEDESGDNQEGDRDDE